MNFFSKRIFAIVLALLMGATAPRVAQADLFTDVLNAAAEAGGWPSDLPLPDKLIALIGVAQDCADASGPEGLKVCVDKAANDPTLGPKFKDQQEKIDLGLDVFADLVHGDYIGILEKLGKTAGCAAAMVLTGVPVCALADLIAGVATAIADIAAEFLALLSAHGAHAVISGPDYYSLYWDSKLPIGVRIKQFQSEYEWDQLLKPLYSGCYDWFDGPGDMSESSATETCDAHRAQFTDAVNAEIASQVAKTQGLIGAAWDKAAVGMHKEWDPKCFQSSGVVDAEAREDGCLQKVADALASGRGVAISAVASCKVSAELRYDIPTCVEIGVENKKMKNALYAAVQPNQQAEAAFKQSIGDFNQAIAEGKYKIAQFNKDVGPWIKQCPGMFAEECKTALRKAWDACQTSLVYLPHQEFGPSQSDIDQAITGCKANYSKLITDFGLKAFATPNALKPYNPAGRAQSQVQRAQQARDESGCPMAKVTPTADQPLDFDLFHLQCQDLASYQRCVHSLGGDLRPSASKCGPPAGFAQTQFVGAPCCQAPRLAPASIGRPAPMVAPVHGTAAPVPGLKKPR